MPELSAKFANRIARCYRTKAVKKEVSWLTSGPPVKWRVYLKHQQITGLAKRLARFHRKRGRILDSPIIIDMEDAEQLCQVWDLLEAK